MDSVNTMLLVAIILAVAFLAQLFTERLKLPTVTGYIILGVFLGSSVVGIVNYVFGWHLPPVFDGQRLRDFGMAGDIALTLVAFAIGAEFDLGTLRKVGRSILFIALLESLGAFAMVGLGVWLLSRDLSMALILGAVASATAPAATVMVIRQYRSRGPLTTTILAVVGLDDAVALMIFSFAAAIAGAILAHQGQISLLLVVGEPVLEIVGALVLGAVLGLVGSALLRHVRSTEQLLAGAGALLLLAGGLAKTWHLSPLLTNMALGMMIVNRNPFLKNRISSMLSSIAPVFYALFFILGGARLNISLLPAIGWLGPIYLLARAAGKIGGAALGARLGKAPQVVRRFVGFGLIPQVGVAVALAILVDQQFGRGQFGQQGQRLAMWVINILLVTTLVTETVGPLLTRLALRRAGEVGMAPGEGGT